MNLNSNFKVPENTVLQMFFFFLNVVLNTCFAISSDDQSMKLRINVD